jgi:hypothetical protein
VNADEFPSFRVCVYLHRTAVLITPFENHHPTNDYSNLVTALDYVNLSFHRFTPFFACVRLCLLLYFSKYKTVWRVKSGHGSALRSLQAVFLSGLGRSASAERGSPPGKGGDAVRQS